MNEYLKSKKKFIRLMKVVLFAKIYVRVTVIYGKKRNYNNNEVVMLQIVTSYSIYKIKT